MGKAILGAMLGLISYHAFASPVGAQTPAGNPPRSISRCTSGLSGGGPDCAPDRRLLIAVTMNGAAASGEVVSIVALAASAAGVFALTPENATAADSAMYGVLNFTRDAQGNYRIDQSIAGSKVRSPDNCRGSSTGASDDMGFGAYLALEVHALVRCVQNARGAPSH